MDNKQLRKQLNDYLEKNYKPSKILLAKELDIEYTYFIKWLNADRNFKQDRLSKIKAFLDKNN